MSEELYTYYNIIISVSVSTKRRVCVCRLWWKLDTRINRDGIVSPLLVGCVGSRGLGLVALVCGGWLGVAMVCCCGRVVIPS